MEKSSAPRLNKYLADLGVGSRREIDSWIAEQRLTCNGQIVALGAKYQDGDEFALDGRSLRIQPRQHSAEPIVLVYYKPVGEISSKKDPLDRPSIFDHLPPLSPNQGRWVQIGRLDFQTSGLILFTNCGALAHTLMHPSAEIEREYIAKVRGYFHPQDRIWKEGADVGDTTRIRPSAFELLEQMDKAYWVRVVLQEGRYRAVRRFFQANDQSVIKLQRSRFGNIELTSDLMPGDYRFASSSEIEELKKLCAGKSGRKPS